MSYTKSKRRVIRDELFMKTKWSSYLFERVCSLGTFEETDNFADMF